MAVSKQGPSSLRSWRGGAKPSTHHDGPSNTARIFWSLAFLGLIGGLIWFLYFRSIRPEAQLAALRIIYEKTTPIPFCDEDAEAFASLEPETDVRKEDRDRSDTIFNFWGEKTGEGGHRKDAVVVYLAARGVSDPDGTAWLLCSGYERAPAQSQGGPAAGRYSLRALLAEVKKRQAPLKLLILDVSYALSDPRAGMMINEFPALVEEEVKKIDDDTLWVLTNSQSLEVEHFSESAHRCVFGYFVTEGLRGEADIAVREGAEGALPRHDGIVDLDELYDFVLRGVGDWVQKNRGGLESQTPCLYHAGKGLVREVPPSLHLRYTVGRAQPAASPEPSDADDLLQMAWEQRDELDRGTPSGWAIVDYAPHLWREYEEILLDYEFRLRSGTVHANRKADLNSKVIAVLKHLPDTAGDADSGEDPIVRLNQARRQFQQQKDNFEAWATKRPSIGKAFQARNRGIRLASHGIRWHRAILGCNVNGEAEYTARVGQLRKLLGSLQTLSPELNKLLVDSGKAGTNPAQTRKLDELTDEVNKHVNDLHKAWHLEAAELAKASLPIRGRAARIEAILAVPVLDAKDRMALLKMRRTLDLPLVVPEKLPPREIPRTAFAPTPQCIARIAVQAELEQAAVRLAVPTANLDWRQFQNANAETLRGNCKEFGKQLIELQASLREELGREAARAKVLLETGHADPQFVAAVDRVLRWADARDIKYLNFIPPPMLGQPLLPTVAVHLVQKNSKKENPFGAVRSYKVKVSVTGGNAAEAELCWDCDNSNLASALEVRSSTGQEHPLSPGVLEKLALVDNSGEVDLIVDLHKVVGPLDSVLKVKARAVGQTGEGLVKLHVSAPDVIRLIASDAAGNGIDQAPGEQKAIQLRPFPNRETAFLLKVKNESESEKELSIEFVAPREWKSSENWDRNVLNERHELADGIIRVFDPISLKIPVGETLPIPFAETPPADKTAEKPVAKPAAAVTAPSGENVTNGFAVLIRDRGDKSKYWVQRIEFKPWKPSDFLEAAFDYNEGRQELHVGLKARDNASFPLDTAKNPIQVRFATNPRSGLGNGAIESRLQNVDFRSRIARDISNKGLRFFFDVDGYPHALQFISPDWSNQPGRIVPDDTLELKITSPKPEAALDASPDKQPVKVLLNFEVYARTDFLHHSEENLKDRIELRTFDEKGRDVPPWTKEQPKVLYTRQQEITLRGVRAHGELKVSTRVGKFEIPLELALPKQKVRIEVSAYTSYTPDFGEQRKSPWVASVPIILDEPPDIRSVTLTNKIETGQALPVEITVKSLSLITQFDCGLEDPDKPDEFAQDPKKVKVNQVKQDTWSARIPTEKLAVGEHKLPLLFRAKNAVGETILKRMPSVVVADPIQPTAAKTDKKPTAPKKGRIVGVVAFKNDTHVKCASGKVRLDDVNNNGGGRPADIDDNGWFEFDDVLHGRHTLSAEGSKGGVKGRGTLEVDLDDSTGSQTILVE